jgi:hypothetical protein
MQLDSDKTAKMLRKYIKVEGDSLPYQVGRLALESGVPKELIAKVINHPDFTQIATMLYLMEYFGNTYSIILYANQVIDFIEKVYVELQRVGEEMRELSEEYKGIVREHCGFVEYKENVGEIAILGRRIIQLGSLCSKKELCSNMDELMGKLMRMGPKDEKVVEERMIPDCYLGFFSEFVCGNSSDVYTLHTQITGFIEEHPICMLCLDSLQERGGRQEDGKFYHYRCWNFKTKVS